MVQVLRETICHRTPKKLQGEKPTKQKMWEKGPQWANVSHKTNRCERKQDAPTEKVNVLQHT